MTGKKFENLCFFTSSYPYGNGENFIDIELKYLSKRFKKIYIFPLDKKGSPKHIPNNVSVVIIPSNWKMQKIQNVMKYGFNALCFFIFEIFPKRKWNYSFFYHIDLIIKYLFTAQQLNKFILDKKTHDFLYYSYWLDEWATVLSILRSKNKIKYLISRAHGFDLYNERNSKKVLDYQNFQIKNIDKVHCISRDGYNYLRTNYNLNHKILEVSCLGSKDYGLSNTEQTEYFSLLSISRVDKNKSLKKIIEILKDVTIPLKWTHYGDGPLLKEIKNLTDLLPNNILVDLKGFYENQKMIKEVKEFYFDCFINVSQSEGIPVSIMEAISLGIPVIAPNVGGISEIINQKNGFLLPKNWCTKDVALEIEEMYYRRPMKILLRQQARNFWKNNFNEKVNFNTFVNKITIAGYAK